MQDYTPPDQTSTLLEIGLFAGIGGFSLAAEWAGIETAFHCEIDEFCRKVLKKNFPKAGQWGDIKTLNKEIINEHVKSRFGTRPVEFILTGGFP